jgi:DNA repair exonuclease SbcCD ATPase subunit
MADSVTTIISHLHEMRAECAALHQETRRSLESLEGRVRHVEQAQASFSHALAARAILRASIAEKLGRRLFALEDKVRRLENRT